MIPTPEDFKKLAEENERLRIGMKALGTARFISCPGPGAVLVVEDRADLEAISANPNACHSHSIMHGVEFRAEVERLREELAEAKAQTFDEAADIVYQHIYGAQNSPEEGTRYIYKLDLRKIFQRRASLLRTQKKP